MSTVIGIDIGLSGAIAAVDSRGTFSVEDLPTLPDGKPRVRKAPKVPPKRPRKPSIPQRLDGRALLLLIRSFIAPGASGVVFIEDVRPRPNPKRGTSIVTEGSLMRSRGVVECACEIARLDLRVVQPQTWKRYFGLLKAEKNASRAKAIELYPEAEIKLNRVRDHNRAESILLARWGLESVA